MSILFTILDVFAADSSGGWFVLLILSLVRACVCEDIHIEVLRVFLMRMYR